MQDEGVGVMVGLFIASGRFPAGRRWARGVAFRLLRIVLMVPFAGLVLAIPNLSYVIGPNPTLVVIGPGLAPSGGLRTARELTAV
jgi:hypothetical protein